MTVILIQNLGAILKGLEPFLGKEIIPIPHHRDSTPIMGNKMDADRHEN